ncbi:hypothetical protein UlMin_009614 [Ulmus minor]
MESADLWKARLSGSSWRYQSRSGADLYRHEEIDGDDELKTEYLCPFCADEFDVVGLCCHIDEEHPVEAKTGVCPLCAKRVGADLVSHITTQHRSFLKISLSQNHVQRKRKSRKSGLAFSMLRKELREGNLQSLLGGSFIVSSNSEPDPLLSSFMYNPPIADQPVSASSHPPEVADLMKDIPKEELPERTVQQPPLSQKDQEETAQKREFVRGLLFSTILDDF